MSTRSKRAKLNGGASPGLPLGETNATNSAVEFDSFPLDVLEHILKADGSSSIPFLKTCRLVSKSWNEVSCRILRKVAAVMINVQEEFVIEKFKDLLLDRHSYFPPDWPNPFQNYKFLEASLSNPAFLPFIRRPNLKITTLEIVHDQDFDAAAFQSVLERHKGTITHLKIKGNCDSVSFQTLTSKLENGGWGGLKSVGLIDTCGESITPCPHVDFVINLTKTVNLEEMSLEGDLRNIVNVFAANKNCWNNLSTLNLECKTLPENVSAEQIRDFMKWAKEMDFPSLTHLMLFVGIDSKPEETSQIYTPYLLPLIQKSAPVLENLRVNFLPLKLLPSCPKLRYLCCALMDGDRIQDTTEQKFPSLTHVFYTIRWKQVPAYSKPKTDDANKKLVSVVTFWGEQTSKTALETQWTSYRDHCPELKKLWVQSRISSKTLVMIRKQLSQLEDLNIREMCSAELLGSSLAPVTAPIGWPWQDFVDCALCDMTNLGNLRLGKFVRLSKELVLMLGQLSQLKFLSFYWNDSLVSADVPTHIKDIKNATIFYKAKEQKPSLERIFKNLKNVKLTQDF